MPGTDVVLARPAAKASTDLVPVAPEPVQQPQRARISYMIVGYGGLAAVASMVGYVIVNSVR